MFPRLEFPKQFIPHNKEFPSHNAEWIANLSVSPSRIIHLTKKHFSRPKLALLSTWRSHTRSADSSLQCWPHSRVVCVRQPGKYPHTSAQRIPTRGTEDDNFASKIKITSTLDARVIVIERGAQFCESASWEWMGWIRLWKFGDTVCKFEGFKWRIFSGAAWVREWESALPLTRQFQKGAIWQVVNKKMASACKFALF
jgi:hypothetical protein